MSMVVSARPDDTEHVASGCDALDSELEEKRITLAGTYGDFVGAVEHPTNRMVGDRRAEA